LGTRTFDQRKWIEAENYDRHAADIYQRFYGPEHQDTTIARNNLASVYLKLGQYARAEKIFSEVIEILVRTHLGDTLNAGITRIKLGRSSANLQKPATKTSAPATNSSSCLP
jgi:tetratricopeptide (TPR) repeat protein